MFAEMTMYNNCFKICLVAIVVMFELVAAPPIALAQTTGQETFKSPEAAAAALFEAAKNKDKPAAIKVLGSRSEDLFNTGDPEFDAHQHQLFVEKYQQMHRLAAVGR